MNCHYQFKNHKWNGGRVCLKCGETKGKGMTAYDIEITAAVAKQRKEDANKTPIQLFRETVSVAAGDDWNAFIGAMLGELEVMRLMVREEYLGTSTPVLDETIHTNNCMAKITGKAVEEALKW